MFYLNFFQYPINNIDDPKYYVEVIKLYMELMTKSFFKNRSLILSDFMVLIYAKENEEIRIQNIRDDWLFQVQEDYSSRFDDLQEYFGHSRHGYGYERSGVGIKEEIWSVTPYLLEVSKEWVLENFKVDRSLLDYMEKQFRE